MPGLSSPVVVTEPLVMLMPGGTATAAMAIDPPVSSVGGSSGVVEPGPVAAEMPIAPVPAVVTVPLLMLIAPVLEVARMPNAPSPWVPIVVLAMVTDPSLAWISMPCEPP
jgi:hypothetical protein